jgi:outer membrane autotransporter protein
VAGAWAAGAVTVRPEVQVLYEHLFGDNSVTSVATIPAVGGTFVTTVSAGDRDRLALGVGTALDFSQSVSAHVRYDGTFTFSGDFTEHYASGGLAIRF